MLNIEVKFRLFLVFKVLTEHRLGLGRALEKQMIQYGKEQKRT